MKETKGRKKGIKVNKSDGVQTSGAFWRRMDGWTDKPSYRDARTHLKTDKKERERIVAMTSSRREKKKKIKKDRKTERKKGGKKE